MKTALLVGCWISCAVLCQGIAVAHFQNKYPTLAAEDYRQDFAFGLAYGLAFGPISLLWAFLLSGFAEHGLQWGRR